MSTGDFSVGDDLTLTIVTSKGRLDITGLMEFTADPMTTDLKSRRISGPKFGFVCDGWKGSFKIDRTDSQVDDWWAQIEADQYSGVNTPPGMITQIVQERNGGTTEWRFVNVTFRLEKAGDWAGDKKVEQNVTFQAERKNKVK